MSVLRCELTITIILDRNFVLRKKNQLKIFSLLSFKSDDGDSNEHSKKAIGLYKIRKTTD